MPQSATQFRGILFALMLPLFAALATTDRIAWGQEQGVSFPGNAAQWLNSPPVSVESLRGKGVFLWFFEESCPNCRNKWPELYALANQFRGEPIVFIAVNSGNPPAVVQQYAREVRLTWPVIVDVDRRLEQQAGVGELSLQNVMQVGLISPSGRFSRGSYREPEQAVRTALTGAKWTVDPEGIPQTLQSAWLAIELGNFPAAGPAVKRALQSPKPDLREAATRLNDAVLERAAPKLESARKAADDNNPWQAYQIYTELDETFRGFELSEDISDRLKELNEEESVRTELAALKALSLIERTLDPRRPPNKGQQIRLQKLIDEFPETTAAQRAQEWLNRTI